MHIDFALSAIDRIPSMYSCCKPSLCEIVPTVMHHRQSIAHRTAPTSVFCSSIRLSLDWITFFNVRACHLITSCLRPPEISTSGLSTCCSPSSPIVASSVNPRATFNIVRASPTRLKDSRFRLSHLGAIESQPSSSASFPAAEETKGHRGMERQLCRV